MAEVWLGADEVLGRQVALKLLHPNLADDHTFVERLQREAVAVARINHPGIVAVYDTVYDAGYEAVVMEYVPGQNLRQLLDARGRLEVDETVMLGTSLADALHAAHEAGIVHRDVKPGNVLLTPEGRVKLTDFGIATAMLEVDELSDDGILLGTAKYVAPEQVQGHLVDGRADLYSLAIVLYECLTGAVPFDGPDERSVALARLRQVPLPVRRLRPDAPPALEQLLATTLRPRPSDRPQTAAIFGTSLRRISLTAPDPAPAPPSSDDTRHLPVDGTRAFPADLTPPFGVSRPTEPAEAPSSRPGLIAEPISRPMPAAAPGPVMQTNQRRASWIVLGLIGAALLMATVLIGLAQRRDPAGQGEPPAPPATSTTAVATTVASPTVLQAPPVSGDVAIVSAAEFDPAPGDGREHPEQLGLLTDGRTDTTWSTLCYRQPTMAPKDGVGLVFWLSGPAGGHTLVLDSPSSGWSASVFVAAEVGARLRDWGPPVDQGDDLGPGTIALDLGDASGRYVLVWLTDLGDPSCRALPHQVRVGEVRVERT
jgi:serine/threonine-protein kinase